MAATESRIASSARLRLPRELHVAARVVCVHYREVGAFRGAQCAHFRGTGLRRVAGLKDRCLEPGACSFVDRQSQRAGELDAAFEMAKCGGAVRGIVCHQCGERSTRLEEDLLILDGMCECQRLFREFPQALPRARRGQQAFLERPGVEKVVLSNRPRLQITFTTGQRIEFLEQVERFVVAPHAKRDQPQPCQAQALLTIGTDRKQPTLGLLQESVRHPEIAPAILDVRGLHDRHLRLQDGIADGVRNFRDPVHLRVGFIDASLRCQEIPQAASRQEFSFHMARDLETLGHPFVLRLGRIRLTVAQHVPVRELQPEIVRSAADEFLDDPFAVLPMPRLLRHRVEAVGRVVLLRLRLKLPAACLERIGRRSDSRGDRTAPGPAPPAPSGRNGSSAARNPRWIKAARRPDFSGNVVDHLDGGNNAPAQCKIQRARVHDLRVSPEHAWAGDAHRR